MSRDLGLRLIVGIVRMWRQLGGQKDHVSKLTRLLVCTLLFTAAFTCVTNVSLAAVV